MVDMDEELRRIIEASMMQGRAPGMPPPDEGMDLATIRRAGEGMTASGGEDLPRGTKVNFAEPDLEVSAPPVRKPLTPRLATPEIPAEKVVQVPGSPAAPDDMEMAFARHQDRMARSSDAFDRGGRQLVAGLTRTAPQDTMKAPSDAVASLLARRKENDATHHQNEQLRLGAARMAYDKAQADEAARVAKAKDERDFGRTTQRDTVTDAEKARTDAEAHRHNLEAEKIGYKNASRPVGGLGAAAAAPLEYDEDGQLIPKNVAQARLGMRQAAISPRPGWEPIDPKATTFRDPEQAKSFDASAAAYGALQNHRAHAAEALKRLHAAKTPAEADTALAEVNQQMANIASKLRVAEGLNSSDASNHAVDTMLSLTNGSVANLRNMANEGRLDAILDSAINSAGTNLDTLAGSANLRRSKTKGGPASGPVSMKFPDGSVHDVDPADMDLAKRKGAVPNGR